MPTFSMSTVRKLFWQVVMQRVRRLLDAQEVGLERLHARGREQDRGVVARGHERPAGQAQVAALLEEAQEQLADLVGGHAAIVAHPSTASPRRKTAVWPGAGPSTGSCSSIVSPRSVHGTGRRAVAQLDGVAPRDGRRVQARVADAHVARGQRGARPDGHGVGARVGAHDVERLGRAADLEAAALADGEAGARRGGGPGRARRRRRCRPGARPGRRGGPGTPRARCRPGSTGPASRASTPRAARARRRSRAPAPSRGRRAGSAAARASRATARRACRPGPWPGRRPGAAGPRACGARSARWSAWRRRGDRRRRASRPGARCRCSARTGWASARRRDRPATARRRRRGTRRAGRG